MRCVLCGGTGASFSGREFLEWKQYACRDCGLEFWDPLEFRGAQYSEAEDYAIRAFGESLSPYHYDAIENLRALPLPERPKILEIGCGNGSFLRLFTKSLRPEAECFGIDLNRAAVDAARETFGDKVSFGDFMAEADFAKAVKFDLVFFFEVLEHQPDPYAFVRNVESRLSEGGIIMGTVPNRNRPLPFGIREKVDFPPHHFTWWDGRPLEFLFRRAGFQDILLRDINRWTITSLSNYCETLVLRPVKTRLKKLLASKRAEGPKAAWSRDAYRAVKSGPAVFARTALFLPMSLPLKVFYLLSGAAGRQLLFRAKKG